MLFRSISGPLTRVWHAELTLSDGSKAIVNGAQMPGGRIDVRFLSNGQVLIAADAGDDIYPSDVRVDHQFDHLYVKASGFLATRPEHQTWLFDYDLRGRRAVARQRVADSGLPPDCPEPPAHQ